MNQLTPPKSIPRRTSKGAKNPMKCCAVLQSFRLTPNMQRVVFDAQDLVGVTPDKAGANLKICVPAADTTQDTFRSGIANGTQAGIIRTFTAASYDDAAQTLTIDFALHEPAGRAPAGDWARDTKPGDLLGIREPSEKKVTSFWGEAYLVYADMTAIPAIAAIISEMPRDATGHAIFEITSDEDTQTLDFPKGLNVHWLVNADPHTPSDRAMSLIRSLDLPDRTQVAGAGEHSVIAALKSHFFTDLGYDPDQHYLSPYWKIGLVEEEHQALKKAERV